MGYRNVRDLLELPVVTESELHMGDVTGAYLDLAEQRLIKLAVEWTQMPDQVSGSDEDLPFSQVSHFEPHQLVVADEIGETAGLDFAPYDEDDLVPASELLDHEVVTRQGRRLGTLVDIFVDEADGAVVGYEVSREEGDRHPSVILPPAKDLELVDGEVLVADNLRPLPMPLRSLEDEDRDDTSAQLERVGRDRKTEQPELYDADADVDEPNKVDNPLTNAERAELGIYE